MTGRLWGMDIWMRGLAQGVPSAPARADAFVRAVVSDRSPRGQEAKGQEKPELESERRTQFKERRSKKKQPLTRNGFKNEGGNPEKQQQQNPSSRCDG